MKKLRKSSIYLVGRASGGLAIALVVLLGGCAPQMQSKVLISMIEPQEIFFRQEAIAPFEKAERVELDVVRVSNTDSLEQVMRSLSGQVSLVKVPFGKGWDLVAKDLVKPLNSFLDPAQMQQLGATFLLTSLAQQNGQTYFVPRKFETRLMVYSKSKVAEVTARWHGYKDSVDAALRLYNGQGLPAAYMLEDDPGQWDFFDVFFVGYVWSRTDYGGSRGGKIAHRGRRYSGTALRIVDRAFSCGAESGEILSMEGEAVADAFIWEAVYAASGVYNPKMWLEKWTGMGVWEGFKANEVFLSFMTQLDCFFIHGTGRDGLQGYMPVPDDMGVAVMPAGCSLELDHAGDVRRIGSRAITTGGWWWAIPASAPDPLFSYRLASHITGTNNQIQECTRFGMIPVRKEILADMSMMFGGGWITEVYQASFQQLMHNQNAVVPTDRAYDRISQLYLDAWFDIVVNRNWPAGDPVARPGAIRELLTTRYVPQARAALGH